MCPVSQLLSLTSPDLLQTYKVKYMLWEEDYGCTASPHGLRGQHNGSINLQPFFPPRVKAINILHIFTPADCGLINTVLQAT